MRRARLVVGAAIAAVGGLLPLVVDHAYAGTVTVPCTGTSDQAGSALQAAFTQADLTPGDDTVQLVACTYQLAQPLQAQATTGTTTIEGVPGATIDGNSATQLVTVAGGAHVAIHNTVLSLGFSQTGNGGAISTAGTLELDGVTLVGNKAVDGGALETSGTTSITRSLFRNNTAAGANNIPGHGPHVHVAGGTLTVTDTTFAASTGAGSVYQDAGTTTLDSTTFAKTDDYSIYVVSGPFTMRRSTLSSGGAVGCLGTITDGGDNVTTDASCPGLVADPKLVPVTSNQGLTLTYIPGPGSPLIDAASSCPSATDARGVARPQGSRCDIGAVESAATASQQVSSAPSVEVGKSGTQTVTITSNGDDDLRIAGLQRTGSSAYAVTNDTCSGAVLPKGQSCSYTVSFTPTDSSTNEQGAVQVVDNGYGASTRRASFSNTGVAPPAPPPTALPTTAPPTLKPTPLPTRTSASPVPTRSLSRISPTAAPKPPVAIKTTVPLTDSTSEPKPRRTRTPVVEPMFFASYVPPPSQVPTTATTLLGSCLLALLLLALLTLPVSVVNETLSTHREDIADRMARIRAAIPMPKLRFEKMPTVAAVLLAAAGSAVINSFLDPQFGWSRASAVDFCGLLGSLLLITVVNLASLDSFCERRLKADAVLRVFPGFWLLAVTTVAVSRTTHFRPGLLLGTLATIQVTRVLTEREDGQCTMFGYVVTGLTAIGAWALYEPVTAHIKHNAAAGQGTSFGMLVLQAVLATVFLGGVGGALFNLIPLDFLDGATLRRWSQPVWFTLFFLATLGFIHVLLRFGDRTDPLLHHLRYLEVLLGIYLVCAGAFWGYWKLQDRKAATTAGNS